MTGPRAFLFWSATMAGCSLLPEKAGVQDPDGDGWAWGEDCDSSRADIHPDGVELCDGLDNDCDGLTDDEDDEVSGQTAGYADADGDGYGDDATEVSSCELPADYVLVGGDCDDADSVSFPGATEEDCADPTDYNCDGSVGYEDADADGSPACQDCDDANPDATGGEVWYRDDDGDGYGDAGATQTACTQPSGYAGNAGDCDDDDGATYPGAVEACEDGVVNDCDGSTADALAACGLEGDVSLATADAKLAGEEASDYAGRSVSGAGDVDGDGLADLLIGAMGRDENCVGASYLVLGRSRDRWPEGGGEVSLAAATARLVGEADYDHAGFAVSGAGDVDGDGNDDVLVGAFNAGNTGSTGDLDGNGCAYNYNLDGPGAAYLMLGLVTGTVDLGESDAKLTGEERGDWIGGAIAGVGDLNDDGWGDLLLGGVNPYTGSQGAANAAYLVLGAETMASDLSLADADAKLVGEGESSGAASSVSGAGDVDGDGLPDLLVGSRTFTVGDTSGVGAIYLVLGPVSGEMELADADARLVGEAQDDQAGSAVSDAGDVNGDGLADVLAGAYAADGVGANAGEAYLVLGPVTSKPELADADASFVGERAGDEAGASVSGAGDVDGDGHSDLLIGAYLADHAGSNAGTTYLVLGPVTGEVALSDAYARLLGKSNDFAGISVSDVGDASGDGLDDLFVGAFAHDGGGPDSGAAYLLLGGGY